MNAIAQLDTAQRADAQQVRLPLVGQLLEHRAVQRHVFDVLKLFFELARSMGDDAKRLTIAPYYSLLGQESATAEGKRQAGAPDNRPRYTVPDVQTLFNDWVSNDEAVVANIVARNDIPEGHVLSAASVQSLLAIANKEKESKQTPLLRGLQYLAPYIAHDDGEKFWDLVEPLRQQVLPDPGTPNKPTPDPAQASLYLDVRSMLGQDERFDRETFTDTQGQTHKPLYLLKECWNGHTEKKAQEQEPYPGFVLIPEGTYPVGDPKVDSDNPKDTYELERNIYMGRTPVTVDQFGAFVADGGYGENEEDLRAKDFWDDQGWAWRHDTEAFQRATPKDENLRKWLERRGRDLRHQPLDWAEQQRVGSRAVHSITWYEARAYVRWLHAQLDERGVFKEGRLKGYKASLPNEWQWEVAARAQWLNKADHTARWPWGDDKTDATKRANIDGSGIGHVSVPGCFAPNAAGLLDMAGNVWEWQDGLFRQKTTLQTVGNKEHQHLPKPHEHVLTDDWMTSDVLAIRGGSWFFDSRGAACSYRGWVRADLWDDGLGFRVMLSLAKNET